MNLNDVTMRNYGRFQALVSLYDESTFEAPSADGSEIAMAYAPLLRATAVIRAAREAGIADALPEPLNAGDPLDMDPTDENREIIHTMAGEIALHINAARNGVSGE